MDWIYLQQQEELSTLNYSCITSCANIIYKAQTRSKHLTEANIHVQLQLTTSHKQSY